MIRSKSDLHGAINESRIDDEENSLKTFCENLVSISQCKSFRLLRSGSRVEIPRHVRLAQLCNISNDKLDVDYMVYILSRCAFSLSQPITESYTGEIIRIYTNETHAGYVKLIKEIDNTELLWSECIYHNSVIIDNDPRHGPAVIESNKLHRLNTDYQYSNPVANTLECKRLAITPQDQVFAVHSSYWPIEAEEWVTRRRPHGFPSKSIIKQIIRYGCDFVQVSHKLGDLDEWRFSFSKAELLINKSWTMSQRNVYTALWAINKTIQCSHMCTYYLKTIMLWAFEEKSSEFWINDLELPVSELWMYMMACLKSKFCPNYFIPGNNMMDALIDTNVSHDICSLFSIISSSLNLVPFILFTKGTSSMANTFYDMPAWIKRSYLIYNQINNEEDNFLNLYSTTFETRVWKALKSELSDIHQGLRSNKMARKIQLGSTTSNIDYFKLSEILLMRAINLCESTEIDTLDCDQVLYRLINNAFTLRDQESVLLSSKQNVKRRIKYIENSNSDTKYTSKGRPGDFLNAVTEIRDNKQSINFRSVETYHFPPSMCFDRFHSYWPGVSPTVSISWFIAKAYLANLYYTTNRDVSQIITTCDDIIDVYNQSYNNERFSEKTFPVLLSTAWTAIYDKEIQELIGFYSLCEYILSDSRNRSVNVSVCTVRFALYLKIRTCELYGLSNETNIEKYCQHVTQTPTCKCDPKVDQGGKGVLDSSLRVCGILASNHRNALKRLFIHYLKNRIPPTGI